MSSIVIAGDTSGSVTLQAPAVAGSTILTLPATSGTVQTSGAGYTTNGVAFASSTSVLATGSALQFNGSQFGVNTTPAQAIDVVTDGGPAIIRSTAYRASDGQAGINLRFARGSVASPTIVLTGDSIGSMEFYPYNGTNFNLQTASITAKVTGTVTTSNIPTALVFNLDAAGSAFSNEKMRLDASGNLGIGTSSPSNRLSVVTASGSDGFISVKSPLTETAGVVIDGGTSSNKGSVLKFSKNASVLWQMGTDSAIIGSTSDNFHLYGGGANAILFSTNATERARIDSSGNFIVGGTTALNSSAGRGNITINGSSNAILNFGVGGVEKGYVYYDGTDISIFNVTNNAIVFGTNATARARIT